MNIFTATGTLITRVDFAASPAVPTLGTFDNAAGLSGAVTVGQLSVAGANGAFAVTTSLGNTETGSPGRVAAVPEPGSYAMLALGMLGVALKVGRQRRV